MLKRVYILCVMLVMTACSSPAEGHGDGVDGVAEVLVGATDTTAYMPVLPYSPTIRLCTAQRSML